MSTDTSGAFGLGPIDQISFAVVDLQATLPLYAALLGDFITRRTESTPDRVSYRGWPASARLLLGFGRTGDVEVGLVEVEEGEAPPLEHLRRHGQGLHHVRFAVDDVAAKQASSKQRAFGPCSTARCRVAPCSPTSRPPGRTR